MLAAGTVIRALGSAPCLAPGSAISAPRQAGSSSDRFVGLGDGRRHLLPEAKWREGKLSSDAKEQTRAACALPGVEPSSRAGTAAAPWHGAYGRRGRSSHWGETGAQKRGGIHPGHGEEGAGSDGGEIPIPDAAYSPTAPQGELQGLPWPYLGISLSAHGQHVAAILHLGGLILATVGAAGILGVMAVGRNASRGIPGNWFYPFIRCRRDGSSLGEGI